MKAISMVSGSAWLVLGMALAAAPALASGVEAHSGILKAIDPAHHTLTLSEMGRGGDRTRPGPFGPSPSPPVPRSSWRADR
jgi:hypothetical protein